MKRCLKIMMVCVVTALLPFIAGCLGSGGFNPVADSSLAESQAITPAMTPTVMGARFVQPTPRKYTFAAPACKVSHSAKNGVSQVAGSMRVKFLSLDQTEKVLLTFEKLRIKPLDRPFLNLSVSSREIDLTQAGSLAELLAETELPNGSTNRSKSPSRVPGWLSMGNPTISGFLRTKSGSTERLKSRVGITPN
jgi:hypothetical protein